ncbi:alpha/beta hydrolase [Devosia sp. 2618]|uniref:RBBP9/YdeN family alpha/beta hydrolase n=1 Tax=Devosia sp. 2618 TaxID=3156454 RepID=UPI003391A24C
MSQTTLIVPGLHGSDAGHWQSWWRQDHRHAVLVEQTDFSNPDADAWLASLENAVRANPHCLIVAHSLGSILTARLATSSVAPLVAGALLVAPAEIERTQSVHHRTYEFGKMPRRPLPFPSLVVASRNDIYMPFNQIRELSTAWGSPMHDLGFAGHINIASGFGRWPQGYALARELEVSIDKLAHA